MPSFHRSHHHQWDHSNKDHCQQHDCYASPHESRLTSTIAWPGATAASAVATRFAPSLQQSTIPSSSHTTGTGTCARLILLTGILTQIWEHYRMKTHAVLEPLNCNSRGRFDYFFTSEVFSLISSQFFKEFMGLLEFSFPLHSLHLRPSPIYHPIKACLPG